MILLEPRISGEPVDRGIVRPEPPGVSPRYALLSVTYQPKAWDGLALDAQFYNGAGRPVHSTDAFTSPDWTEANLGVRYSFTLRGAPASFRAQVQNVTDNYGWNVNQSGSLSPRSPRRFLANFTVDF
jgi:iron complex outermembrane receptor protein